MDDRHMYQDADNLRAHSDLLSGNHPSDGDTGNRRQYADMPDAVLGESTSR
jgi:hypothetical protein